MNDAQSTPQPARTVFMVVKEQGMYNVYRNNRGIYYGFKNLIAANTYCEQKARTYSHNEYGVMRQGQLLASDVAPSTATVGQEVWVVEV